GSLRAESLFLKTHLIRPALPLSPRNRPRRPPVRSDRGTGAWVALRLRARSIQARRPDGIDIFRTGCRTAAPYGDVRVPNRPGPGRDHPGPRREGPISDIYDDDPRSRSESPAADARGPGSRSAQLERGLHSVHDLVLPL